MMEESLMMEAKDILSVDVSGKLATKWGHLKTN